ncbi:unnamed protein product [Phytophthora lilii]|uniref:Unnamed protein product n=1 Tax=Phytophthora lilii TaxID=2077276 RepID=A0A9W6WY15_9STRA|nr:unnamed protein product [Phytophthora lilii]
MLVNLLAFSRKTAALENPRLDTAAVSRDDTGSQEDHSGDASADSEWASDSDGDRSSGAEIAECSDDNASDVCDKDTRIILINDDRFPVRNSVGGQGVGARAVSVLVIVDDD